MTETKTEEQGTLFTQVASQDDESVKRYQRAADESVSEEVRKIAEAHPAVSPWYSLPDDEKKAKAMLRKIRVAARDLERRVITGTHVKTGQPTWALGGPSKPRAGTPQAAAEQAATSGDVAADEEPVDADAETGKHVTKGTRPATRR